MRTNIQKVKHIKKKLAQKSGEYKNNPVTTRGPQAVPSLEPKWKQLLSDVGQLLYRAFIYLPLEWMNLYYRRL